MNKKKKDPTQIKYEKQQANYRQSMLLYNQSAAYHEDGLDICNEDWKEDLRHHTKKRHIALKMLKNLAALKKIAIEQKALNK